MIGKPKYKCGDMVSFKIGDNEKNGMIYIIDAYGTFEDDSDVSYDIMVENDEHWATRLNENGEREKFLSKGDCLYKHIREDYVTEIKTK